MTQTPMTTIDTKKTVQQTLADLRSIFRKYDIEDWEPVPAEAGPAYTVRWHQSGQWMEVSSHLQPSKAQNLRQCYQVTQYLFLWGSRGVGGVASGATFIHGGLATTGARQQTVDEFAEACAVIGVEPETSWDEIQQVFRAKTRFAHPDGAKDAAEKAARGARMARLNAAMEILKKVKAPR